MLPYHSRHTSDMDTFKLIGLILALPPAAVATATCFKYFRRQNNESPRRQSEETAHNGTSYAVIPYPKHLTHTPTAALTSMPIPHEGFQASVYLEEGGIRYNVSRQQYWRACHT
ncbi:hypothetical protein GGR52DRAFT_538466 [Hypoxylon sp. FL1284]|nr:hypothetical protein GGR52DRAFT_538466 [Hypoxylon sp. FL1284]